MLLFSHRTHNKTRSNSLAKRTNSTADCVPHLRATCCALRPALPPPPAVARPAASPPAGKCARGESCTFLHSIGDSSGSSLASADAKSNSNSGGKENDEDNDSHNGTPVDDSDTLKPALTSKMKVKAMPKAKLKASTSARVDSEGDDDGAPPPPPPPPTAAERRSGGPGEAAAGAGRVPLSSKARFGGAAKATARPTAGGPAGSWARIVKREYDTNNETNSIKSAPFLLAGVGSRQ